MEVEKIWKPIPNSSQALAIDCRASELLICGTRGGGKSESQLFRFRRFVGIGYGAFWKGIIFDKEYKSLDDLKAKALKWFPRFGDGAKWLSSVNQHKWVWPTGEELSFRAAENVLDYDKYHGHEYAFIGWNELTKYPSDELYLKMMSVNRTSFRPEDYPRTIHRPTWENYGIEIPCDKNHPEAYTYLLPEIPLQIFSTTNPFGPGHSWVKKRFIDGYPYGQMRRTVQKVYSAREQKEVEVVKTRVAIFSSWRENPYLPVEYIADLMSIKDKSTKKAWLDGSWDIVAGGAVSDVWDSNVHILPRFKIPSSWRIDRAFDWGSSHPFYVGWFAEANGEEAVVVVEGEEYSFCPPPKTLILFFEYYGTEEIGSNIGLKLSAKAIAREINKIEEGLMFNRWIDQRPSAGPADNQIRDTRESDVDTIENKMLEEGVAWEKSDKSPGSRINGLQIIRDRLQNAIDDEGPGLYFMINCQGMLQSLPNLPRDKKKLDDVDTEAEDHPYDALRYRVLSSGNVNPPKNFKVEFV